MAYMNQERKAKISAKLKEVLKGINIKYSLRVHNHSSIIMTIKEGSIDFIKNWEQVNNKSADREYLQVNHYWLKEHFSAEALEVLEKIKEAMRAADWYDKSDSMVDYFDTAYYYSINIGDWCKPYKVI
jgi:predicted transcriptional regulator